MQKLGATATAIGIGIGLLLAEPAGAVQITVQNPSFETLPEGGLPFGDFGEAWSYDVGIPGWGTTGSDTGQYYPGGRDGNPPANDGEFLAFTDGGTIFQTVANVVAGATYTLQVEVLHRTDAGVDAMAQLEVGANVVASAVRIDAGPGTWNNWIVSFTATAAESSQPLTILLSSSGAGGSQADFDNVRLSTVGVPGPQAGAGLMSALGCGAFGLWRQRRRKRLN